MCRDPSLFSGRDRGIHICRSSDTASRARYELGRNRSNRCGVGDHADLGLAKAASRSYREERCAIGGCHSVGDVRISCRCHSVRSRNQCCLSRSVDRPIRSACCNTDHLHRSSPLASRRCLPMLLKASRSRRLRQRSVFRFRRSQRHRMLLELTTMNERL